MTETAEREDGKLLAVEHARKDFVVDGASVSAVAGVSLHVRRGEFVAIHGASGCGKSTLMFMAGGLLAPDEGSVRVGGEDPYALNGAARADFRARRIGFVFQDFNLVPYLDVADNVLAPSLARAANPGELVARADAMLERFGLAGRRKHRPAELSAGERQRVALARAFLLSPPLILADEPTGNLDRENTEIVLGHFADYVKNGDTAVLMVTHDDHAVARTDRAVEMEGGVVVG